MTHIIIELTNYSRNNYGIMCWRVLRCDNCERKLDYRWNNCKCDTIIRLGMAKSCGECSNNADPSNIIYKNPSDPRFLDATMSELDWNVLALFLGKINI